MNPNRNAFLKLAAALMAFAVFGLPAWPQNPAQPQNPPSGSAQPLGGASGSQAAQQAKPLPEYPLPANGAPDAMPRRYVDMWNTGDFQLLKGMFTAQPYLHYPAVASLAMPASLIINRINLWRNCVPDLKFQILDTINQNDKIIVMRLRYTGTYKKQCYNDIPAPAPGSAPMDIHAYEVLIFWLNNEGKISDIWEQNDEMRVRLQMGAKWCDSSDDASNKAEPRPPAAISNPPAGPAPSSSAAPPIKP